LALTDLGDNFLVEVGSDAGQALVAGLAEASEAEKQTGRPSDQRLPAGDAGP